jgi:hypothetical protein
MKCAGCGRPIGPNDAFYKYAYPNDPDGKVVAACHSDRYDCLITMNAKWHKWKGRPYDEAFYMSRQSD